MDKFDIHKWQRDANTTVNEAHSVFGHPGYSQRVDDIFKAFAFDKDKFGGLERDEKQYIVDQLQKQI